MTKPQVQETWSGARPLPKEGESLSRHAHRPDYRIDPDTGCWLWLKTLNRKGYGSGELTDEDDFMECPDCEGRGEVDV